MTAHVEEHTLTVEAHGLTLTATACCAVLACDHPGCGAVYAREGHAVDVADAEARSLGWTGDGERDGCPLHPMGGGE